MIFRRCDELCAKLLNSFGLWAILPRSRVCGGTFCKVSASELLCATRLTAMNILQTSSFFKNAMIAQNIDQRVRQKIQYIVAQISTSISVDFQCSNWTMIKVMPDWISIFSTEIQTWNLKSKLKKSSVEDLCFNNLEQCLWAWIGFWSDSESFYVYAYTKLRK